MHVLLAGPEFEENLSLRYLAAALRAAGHTASLVRFDSLEFIDGVVQAALREQPGIVGLSMVFQVRAREFFDLARALRRAGYAGHITAGGHFATFAYAEILSSVPEITSIVRQEGEATLTELAAAVQAGAGPELLARIPGVVVRGASAELLTAPRREQVKDLDSLPWPARDGEPERHLGVPTAYLVGSRGCYADCDYCSIFAWHEAAIGKRYRLRSAARIADEMADLYRNRGIRFFVFHDDNFFLPSAAANRRRLEQLNEEIQARGLHDIGLMLKLRPNDCDRENMTLLKQMGLLRAFVGIENASQRQIRSLGRDSTVEDINACLAMLQEMGIYATYNILMFDPYTRLEDVAQNLAFLRQNLFFPFNWCKVEPYAGTTLERRYGQEGRLRGDYLGYDYVMDDPRVRLLYDILLPSFHYRNFDYYGLANLNIGLGYHLQLLKHFCPGAAAPELCGRVQSLIESVNLDAIELLERALAFASQAAVDDAFAVERFCVEHKRDSFQSQNRLSEQIETVLREIENITGVRDAALHMAASAFTPLNTGALAKPAPPPAGRKALNRRGVLAVLAGSMAALAASCARRLGPYPEPPHAAQKHWPPGTPLQGLIRVAPGQPTTVRPGEPFTLQAELIPGDVELLGPPRITSKGGQIHNVRTGAGPDDHIVQFEYLPGDVQAELDPNTTVSAAWTVRGADTDTVVAARAFVHVIEDGSFTFGYTTPRPTIAEMAAPPIYQGPHPGHGRKDG